MSQEEDSLLLKSALDGCSVSVGKILLKYQDRLFNTLMYILGNAEDAGDVMQETFIRAMLHLDTFRGECPFYAWLYRIAVNCASSARRSRRVSSLDELKNLRESATELNSREEQPDIHMQREETCACVWKAVGLLDEPFRNVLILKDLENYEYQEIAYMLGIPLGTVRSRLYRAREQMARILEAQETEIW